MIQPIQSYPELLVRLKVKIMEHEEWALFGPIQQALITDEIPTMATDGKYIYINPIFVDRIGDEIALSILLHELLHDILKHDQAKWAKYSGDDLLDKEQWDHLANIAMDITINENLIKKGYKLTEGAASRVKWDVPENKPLSSFQIFSLLLTKAKADIAFFKRLLTEIDKRIQEEQAKEKLIALPKVKQNIKAPVSNSKPKPKPQPKSDKKDPLKGLTREQVILLILQEQALYNAD